MVLGFSIFFAPSVQVTAGLIPPFQGQEEALYRMVSMTVGFIGHFYLFAGRGQSKTFGLSSVLDRVLIPLFVVFLYQVSSVDLMIVLTSLRGGSHLGHRRLCAVAPR